ncbi:MAG: CRISPR-associated endoribonuclease Cas6 [Bacteroidetes bacterium]|nr:CRISPR-associated endoribonuclease Cas6 [Bacteroidota bacterium]MBU2586247.1 CRISPR-associated endoribonuclease Cas6 [Bacteroidota bacterium]
MRLRVKLKCVSSRAVIPINYNYQFSAAIYLLLRFGSEQFAKFLHDIGFQSNGKIFKLFVFGVEFEKTKIDSGMIKLIEPNLYLTISSPLIDTFIQNFVIGSFEKQNVYINYMNSSTKLDITQIESLPEPQFQNEMSFRLISPMTLSTVTERNGKLLPYYFRYDDEDLVRVLRSNLINKYKVIHKKDFEEDNFQFDFDADEIKKKGGKVSKLITIAENTPQQTKVKAIQCSFKIKANPELIKIGYDCGFGEKNSMGFGLADTRHESQTRIPQLAPLAGN